ncbi:hypothetical protein diail_3417 [Diaporthe ilicicola]|nr:hypothetical protein diail_3417 [Diaporthe ilicicola]
MSSSSSKKVSQAFSNKTAPASSKKTAPASSKKTAPASSKKTAPASSKKRASSSSKKKASSSNDKKGPSPGPTASSTSIPGAVKTSPPPYAGPLASKSNPWRTVYRPLEADFHHEDLNDYLPGGYHPVIIGDKLGKADRFHVLRKLAAGTSGIVWMCWDSKARALRAVKVMKAKAGKVVCAKEMAFLKLLSGAGDQVSIEEAYKNHLAAPLEHFWQIGPNGIHMCIVMPVLGPDVQQAKSFGDVDFLRDVCAQVTSGLAFLHSRGFAHGDLHPSNILIQTSLSDLKSSDVNYLLTTFRYESLYAEGQKPEGPGPHAPKYIYEPMDWHKMDPKYFKKEIAIIDFGASFHTSRPPDWQTISLSLRAPEQFFDGYPSQATDLWSLGCTFMHILGSSNPFAQIHTDKKWYPKEKARGRGR